MLESQATKLTNCVRMPRWRILGVDIFSVCMKYSHVLRVSNGLLCRFRFFFATNRHSPKISEQMHIWHSCCSYLSTCIKAISSIIQDDSMTHLVFASQFLLSKEINCAGLMQFGARCTTRNIYKYLMRKYLRFERCR